MNCPNDNTPLIAGEAEAHTGYGCGSCGGSWLPKKYVDSIKFSKDFDPSTFYSLLAKEDGTLSKVSCPSACGLLTTSSNLHAIYYCSNCRGVWFSKNALKHFLAGYRSKGSSSNALDTPNVLVAFFDFVGAIFK